MRPLSNLSDGMASFILTLITGIDVSNQLVHVESRFTTDRKLVLYFSSIVSHNLDIYTLAEYF